MKFIIISAVYNMSGELKHNIETLKSQTFINFEVYFGDDLSTDNSCQIIEENIKDDLRFNLVRHQKKLYSIGNIAETIKYANPNHSDVIVLIDGDDSLADATSLEYLKNVYEKRQCWMTFGSYTVNGKVGENCSPYPACVQRFNLFRFTKWRANHLKTFKFALWKSIDPASFTLTKDEQKRVLRTYLLTGRIRTWLEARKIKNEDLVTEDGRYTRRCSDKYITLPLLELSGSRAVYIDKILYHYLGPQGPHDFGSSSKKWSQRLLRSAVTFKPRYKKLKVLE